MAVDSAKADSRKQLFRSEALASRAMGEAGAVVDAPVVSWMQLAWLLVAASTILIMALAPLQFGPTETLRGHLRPSAGEVEVVPAKAGILVSLNVSVGSSVAAGEILATVGTRTELDESASVGQLVQESLVEQISGARAQRLILDRTYRLVQERLTLEMKDQQSQIDSFTSSLDLLTDRVELGDQRLQITSRLLGEGAASADELRLRQDNLLALRQQREELLLRLRAAQARQATLAIEQKVAAADFDNQRSALDEKVAQLEASLFRARAEDSFVIKAPVDGQVGSLRTGIGGRVDVSTPILTILPAKSELEGRAFALSNQILQIEPGQNVRVRLQATGADRSLRGTVKDIARTTIVANEARIANGVDLPAYEVAIQLENQVVDVAGEQVMLRSGMEFVAEIQLPKRPLYQWLLPRSPKPKEKPQPATAAAYSKSPKFPFALQ